MLSDNSIIYSCSSPTIKSNPEPWIFIANGYKISKGKKPWGDAFFTSKNGIGVADGVGGWCSYGIDPSSFSEQLMDQWKRILKTKEQQIINSISGEAFKNNGSSKKQKSLENQESDEEEGNEDRLANISNAFGVPVRNNKIKRVRSSFHLDEHWLREWNGKKKGNMKDEFSPVSDSPKNKPETPTGPVRLDPKSVLKQAFKSVTAFGSSTALVCSLQNQTFKVANLGDSTCMLIRFNAETKMSKIILKTDEQQHNFNAPYQLAKIPDNLKDFKISTPCQNDSKKKFWKDKISDWCLYQCEVREGDIVIWATDGLFDNLYSKEIIRIVDVFMSECMSLSSKSSSLPSHKTFSDTPESNHTPNILMTKKNAKRLAKELVKEAYRKSKSKTCFTPFGDKFDKTLIKKDNEILKWKGGKPDDICAVVGFVKSADFFAF